ncbi:Tetrapyrrole (corrin/porphyrin) methylase [Novymonas esmeraldas]|uniref:Tetrapyrrole (Corrin/porphyrin) methylase n=1 Tax=Novymonas esmeraldas TaxID=1808958 RepID=A0AAW0F4S9_9TRYP
MLGWSAARLAAALRRRQRLGALYRNGGAVATEAALVTAARGLGGTARRLSGTFHYRKARLAPENAVDPLSKPTTIDKGALHVVSVPIGNLKDFSLRALDVLRGVDYIISTDRPATKTLLDLVNIPNQGKLIHYSRGNRTSSREKLVELLKGGRSMALVTTSGTPCIGDVGGELVQEMQRSGIRVTAVPGASAIMSALAVSGLTTSAYESAAGQRRSTHPVGADGHHSNDVEGGGGGGGLSPQTFEDGSFFFGNVLPESHGARLRLLRSVVAPATFPCVFYEVPRRLVLVLQDIAALLPHRRVYVTHELTKLNESLHADTAERLVGFYLRQEAQMLLKKGQLVLVIAGAGPTETAAWLEKEAARRRRLRRTVGELMESPTRTDAATPATREVSGKGSQSFPGGGGGAKPARGRLEQRRRRRAELRRRRLRRRRDRLIREIETEQERLRVNLAIHRDDASRLP